MNIEEMAKGKYDICNFYPEPRNGYENAPDYTGPIQVVNVGEKGRGIIATRDIADEELVFASKAFICHPTDSIEHLTAAFIRMLNEDPRVRSKAYKLCAGKEHQTTLSEYGGISAERVKKIIDLNKFNGLTSTGIWLLPSYLNHNCIDYNCNWVCYGNFLFVRAVRAIRKGEELLIRYVEPSFPYFTRLKVFLDREFVCICKLCRHDKNYAFQEERKGQILGIVHNLPKKNTAQEIKNDIVALEIYVQEFYEIGRVCGKPEWNFAVSHVLIRLFHLYEELYPLTRVTHSAQGTIAKEIHKVLNECPVEEGGGRRHVLWFGAASMMAGFCLKTRDWEGLGRWIKIVKKDLHVPFGDCEAFRTFYNEIHTYALEFVTGY